MVQQQNLQPKSTGFSSLASSLVMYSTQLFPSSTKEAAVYFNRIVDANCDQKNRVIGLYHKTEDEIVEHLKFLELSRECKLSLSIMKANQSVSSSSSVPASSAARKPKSRPLGGNSCLRCHSRDHSTEQCTAVALTLGAAATTLRAFGNADVEQTEVVMGGESVNRVVNDNGPTSSTPPLSSSSSTSSCIVSVPVSAASHSAAAAAAADTSIAGTSVAAVACESSLFKPFLPAEVLFRDVRVRLACS